MFRLTRFTLRDTLVTPAGTATTWFQRWWQSSCEAIEGAVSGLQQAVIDIQTAQDTADAAQDTASEAGAVTTYTAGGSAISAPRVLMTTNGSRTVSHADPATWTNAARIVGISVASAVAGAPVEARWLGEMSYDGWAWDLTKRIFLGSGGQLTQTAPSSGFIRCVGQPITTTSMRVDIDAPIFRS